MMITQVVFEKNLEKSSFLNICFPLFNFRKAAGVPSADWLNMLGKPTEQFIFIPYVYTYLNQIQQSKHKS